MAINNFKAFALDPNANVMPQADWEALPALLSGFTAGKASSAQVNKAIRQATTIAALVGQFIANSGVDALDNADVNGLVTKFTDALTTNLSLGTASLRDVGTGANQIPDMNSFQSGSNSNGTWLHHPSGVLIQFGFLTSTSSTSGVNATFPTPFTSVPVYSLSATSNSAIFATASGSNTTAISGVRTWTYAGVQQKNAVEWIAIGL
ncbi:gp53-like domain-containing protein [Escherichia coli]|uniref:gp53-like domain-containing protein n=1 Tax=Escherichia coli TaxID=562 RepID=UPI0020234F3F|nr:hypothetical protein [Escherichia coli]